MTEANQWIVGLLEQTKSAESKRTKSVEGATPDTEKAGRGLRAFNAHEVVIPGLDWYWRMSIDRPSDAQVGLILMALSKMEQERIAGGMQRTMAPSGSRTLSWTVKACGMLAR